jgi:MBOAT membrane-bound O-acyltransferase family protein
VLPLWLLAYGIKIYFDFAGYSDVAIGSARLFGIRVPENFDWPYLRANVSDFWRNWHISLSQWLFDYIFIPLGGSRVTRLGNYSNLIVTMLVSGVWHGAGTNFIVWRLWRGMLLTGHRIWRDVRGRREPSTAGVVIATAFTFVMVNLGWAFFCMDLPTARLFLTKMFLGAPLPCRADALALGVLAALLVRNQTATQWVRQNIRAGYVYFAILLCASLAMVKMQEIRFTETFVISLLDQMYFCLLVLLLLAPLRPMTWMFRSNWLRWVGKVSYCTYLIHLVIWNSIFRIAGYSEPVIKGFRGFSVAMLSVAVIFAVAQLSWTHFEQPLNRRAHRLFNY